tara:strand:- start:213 stop:425 length:213 start_codon:yes stop_codon:yes gene_type:complete
MSFPEKSKHWQGLDRLAKTVVSLPDKSPLRPSILRLIGKHLDGGFDYWYTKSGKRRPFNKGGVVKGNKKK